MIRVAFDAATHVFYCVCDKAEKLIIEKAGFHFNPIRKRWESSRLSRAIRLREYFDESAKAQTERHSVELTPWPGEPVLPPHQKLRPYQIEAVRFALGRNYSYLAFEQGLGKTPTAISLLNSVALPTLILSPPHLVENWKRELRDWMRGGEVENVVTGELNTLKPFSDVLILPDSILAKPAIQDFLKDKDFGLLIIEEAHRFKEESAERTKALVEFLAPRIPKIVFLSGTPLPNRPIELWAILKRFAHGSIGHMDFREFAFRYCGAYETKWGLNYRGHSNLEELHQRIQKDFMMRKTKAEVLPELKPKEERIVSLSVGNKPNSFKALEGRVKAKIKDVHTMVQKAQLGELAGLRKETGLLKCKPAIEYIRDILAETDEQILVFAWHSDVIAELLLNIIGSRCIEGSTSMKDRDKKIVEFQEGKYRTLIAQIQTMVGYNLTNASRGIFVEFSWSPADNAQAADRMHRIGQKNSVTIDYLTLANSIDERVIESLVQKKKVINKVLEGRELPHGQNRKRSHLL